MKRTRKIPIIVYFQINSRKLCLFLSKGLASKLSSARTMSGNVKMEVVGGVEYSWGGRALNQECFMASAAEIRHLGGY